MLHTFLQIAWWIHLFTALIHSGSIVWTIGYGSPQNQISEGRYFEHCCWVFYTLVCWDYQDRIWGRLCFKCKKLMEWYSWGKKSIILCWTLQYIESSHMYFTGGLIVYMGRICCFLLRAWCMAYTDPWDLYSWLDSHSQRLSNTLCQSKSTRSLGCTGWIRKKDVKKGSRYWSLYELCE